MYQIQTNSDIETILQVKNFESLYHFFNSSAYSTNEWISRDVLLLKIVSTDQRFLSESSSNGEEQTSIDSASDEYSGRIKDFIERRVLDNLENIPDSRKDSGRLMIFFHFDKNVKFEIDQIYDRVNFFNIYLRNGSRSSRKITSSRDLEPESITFYHSMDLQKIMASIKINQDGLIELCNYWVIRDSADYKRLVGQRKVIIVRYILSLIKIQILQIAYDIVGPKFGLNLNSNLDNQVMVRIYLWNLADYYLFCNNPEDQFDLHHAKLGMKQMSNNEYDFTPFEININTMMELNNNSDMPENDKNEIFNEFLQIVNKKTEEVWKPFFRFCGFPFKPN